MMQPELFHQFESNIAAGFYGKPLDFTENAKGEIPAMQHIEFSNEVAFAAQTHGSIVISVSKPGKYESVDGFITQEKNLPLLIKTADCIAALCYDPQTKTIAAIHAGWRGLAQKILTNAIVEMKQGYKVQPSNLFIALSPSIHFPQFSDPYNETPDFFHPFINGKKQIDLWAVVKAELLENGVLEKNIAMPTMCTYIDPQQKWWSHRRGDSERNGSIIYLKEE